MGHSRVSKITTVSAVVLFCAFLALYAVLHIRDMPPAGWFKFALSSRMDGSSPANVGRLVLDAPAGNHGFLMVKDGSFIFEDGTPARFWGTNLAYSACFPEKKDAVILADYLAFFGFNAVRFHHMDSFFEPDGIFADPLPESEDPQKKKTGVLSPGQFDKLDYLFYQLKKRGIYVDFNLLVSRRFTLADGVAEAEELKPGAKSLSMFDERMIELQKTYAKELLTHYNPYTHQRYAADPALALIEIVNESSIFKIANVPLPPFYMGKINDAWEDFPKGEYATYNDARKAFTFQLEKKYFEQMYTFLKDECSVKVPITGIGGYNVEETLESMAVCDYIDTHAYWDHPSFPRERWAKNDFQMHLGSMLGSADQGIVGEIAEHDPGKDKPYTISEWNHSYPNPYAYETPVLLAYQALKNGWDALFQYAFSHSLEDYPGGGMVRGWFDISSNTQQLILSSVGSFLMHTGEEDLHGSTESGAMVIDSSFIKGAFGGLKGRSFSLGKFSFSCSADGAVFIYSSDGKPVEVSERLILIVVGRVKNTLGGWEGQSYVWGKRPVLMEEVGITFSFKGDGNTEVYALDEKGKGSKSVLPFSRKDDILFSTIGASSCWFEVVRKMDPGE